MGIYANPEIEEFMNRVENYPEFSSQAQDFIRNIHSKYAPSNIYDPKTFDHLKELEVRRLLFDKYNKQQLLSSNGSPVAWKDIS